MEDNRFGNNFKYVVVVNNKTSVCHSFQTHLTVSVPDVYGQPVFPYRLASTSVYSVDLRADWTRLKNLVTYPK
jgi:hypothetical protein